MNGPQPDAASVARTLEALRTRRPLVQCLTNTVSANFVANVLLAVGAAPAMVDNPEEAAAFAAIADAVLLNLGTPTAAQAEAMDLAAAAARVAGTPVVLDPIGAGALPWRGAAAARLLAHRPSAIRGNASEIAGLARLIGGPAAGGGGRGVDSRDTPEAVTGAASALLAHADAVSASGAIDHVLGGDQAAPTLVRIAGGTELLARVTATGCALGAVAAAAIAAASDPLAGLVAAHAIFAAASERAADGAAGPGSFAARFLDALASLGPAELAATARIDVVPFQEA